MKNSILLFSIVLCFFAHCALFAQTETQSPLKYIEGCEIDLDGDSQNDISLLMKTNKGFELIVLLKKGDGYKTLLLWQGDSEIMNMSCCYGKSIKAFATDRKCNKKTRYETNGTYIRLSEPEGSCMAFYWKNGKFEKVWVSD
jgi:hypothetical protein